MLINLVLIALGLIILIIAGDLLVRGAVSLAQILKIPTLLISLTIVAFGTSAPELFVTISSIKAGTAGLAMGNIIGSNIANILLVLGLPAIIYPICFATPGLRRHGAALTIATLAFTYVVYINKAIDFGAGVVLFSMIVAYIIYIWYAARTTPGGDPTLDEVDEYSENDAKWKTPLYLLVGLIGLPLGAKLLVDNGVEMARILGVRDEVIGLTIVAFGTSLPELATVYAAALRKQADVAVGNIIGSNIFNLLFVGGIAGFVGTSTFDDTTRALDMPVMLAATAMALALVFTKGKLTRILGIFLTLAYLSYIGFLGLNAGIV